MEGLMDLLEPRCVDVSVDLCCGDAAMAEHLLHLTQIGAAGEEVRRKAVAEGVRRDALRQA